MVNPHPAMDFAPRIHAELLVLEGGLRPHGTGLRTGEGERGNRAGFSARRCFLQSNSIQLSQTMELLDASRGAGVGCAD